MALVPVFQASKFITDLPWTGIDYDYPVGIEAAKLALADGYNIDCVAFVAQDTPTPGYVKFQRWLCNRFHFYTTDTRGESLNGWTQVDATQTAYLMAPTGTPVPGMVNLARYVSPSRQTGVGHFFCAKPSVTPPPPGWSLEDATGAHTGWVYTPARVDLVVDYNGNGQSSGITVTGGNATGQTVTIDGLNYVMQAEDALVGFGAGNWVSFTRKPSTFNWHFADISIVKANPNTPDSLARFEKLFSNDHFQLSVIDDDEDTSSILYAYKYTLTIQDDDNDQPIVFDPKIINRAPAVTN